MSSDANQTTPPAQPDPNKPEPVKADSGKPTPAPHEPTVPFLLKPDGDGKFNLKRTQIPQSRPAAKTADVRPNPHAPTPLPGSITNPQPTDGKDAARHAKDKAVIEELQDVLEDLTEEVEDNHILDEDGNEEPREKQEASGPIIERSIVPAAGVAGGSGTSALSSPLASPKPNVSFRVARDARSSIATRASSAFPTATRF